MKNSEKFTTAKERAEAFDAWVRAYPITKISNPDSLAFVWLDLEAPAEELLPCPFCGSDDCCVQTDPSNNTQLVWCENCGYNTGSNFTSEHAAIAEHNRVARAAKEKEANDANA